MERVKGVEPSYSAWKAAALPLCYTRKSKIPPKWWKGVDSNHRTQKRADLQSAAINHSATFPLSRNFQTCQQLYTNRSFMSRTFYSFLQYFLTKRIFYDTLIACYIKKTGKVYEHPPTSSYI